MLQFRVAYLWLWCGVPCYDVCSHYVYRVGLVVVHLGWVGFDLNVPPCCPAAQQIQPNSHLPKHNLAGSGMTQIYVNQTQSTTTSPSLYSQVTLVLLNDRVQKRLDDLYFRALLLHEVDRGHYVSQSGELDLSDSNTHFPLHIFARMCRS